MRLDVRPSPPLWAIQAGLPEPKDDESFVAYVTRLGLDSESLLEDLMPRTAELANLRLASRLMEELPREFRTHVEALSEAVVEPTRLVELRRFGFSFMPRRFVPRYNPHE